MDHISKTPSGLNLVSIPNGSFYLSTSGSTNERTRRRNKRKRKLSVAVQIGDIKPGRWGNVFEKILAPMGITSLDMLLAKLEAGTLKVSVVRKVGGRPLTPMKESSSSGMFQKVLEF